MALSKSYFELFCFSNATEELVQVIQFEASREGVSSALGVQEYDLYDSYPVNAISCSLIEAALPYENICRWDFKRYSYFVELV